jgi:hypothetical protein
VSRYYDIDPADPDSPKELERWDGPYGVITPGCLAVYANPQVTDDSGGMMTVEEIIDFGGGHPPLAVTTTSGGETWEMTAGNLAPAEPVDGSPLARHPDTRLRLILVMARTLAGRADIAGISGSALAAHILAMDGDLRNKCALPTRWAGDGTARDDDRPGYRAVADVPLPGYKQSLAESGPPDQLALIPDDPAAAVAEHLRAGEDIDPGRLGRLIAEHEADTGTDAVIAAWVRVNADEIRQAIFDATEHRDEHHLPPAGRPYGRLAEEFSEMAGDDL